MKRIIILSLAALAVFIDFNLSSCSCMIAKKPEFKNTQWVYVGHTFIADVGTSTDTYTLEFTSNKDCLWKIEWSTPSHPAMYMNPDGTVDTIPGMSSEHVSPATWQYSRNKLTLTFEDGSTRTFLYQDGRLVGSAEVGGPIILEKKEE